MKYTFITEVTPPPIKFPTVEYSHEQIMNLLTQPMHIDSARTANASVPYYTSFEISEETFKFIESVSIIDNKFFGEKRYKINNIEFTILKEE